MAFFVVVSFTFQVNSMEVLPSAAFLQSIKMEAYLSRGVEEKIPPLSQKAADSKTSENLKAVGRRRIFLQCRGVFRFWEVPPIF